jgi:outer membrane lipoprotein SlyB
MRLAIIIVLSLSALTACQSRPYAWEPIIDRQGVDMNRYLSDLAECKSYGDEVQVAQTAASGAAGGAAVGGAVGVIVGDSSRSAARGAGVGAIAGGTRSAAAAQQERNIIIRNCLTGRGYRVLN